MNRQKLKHICKICKTKEICSETFVHGKGMCSSCAAKERLKNPKERERMAKLNKKVNPKCSLKYGCKVCGNKISYQTALYGLGMCKICGGKKYKATEQTKNLLSKSGKKLWQEPEYQAMMSLARGGTGIPYENSKYPEEFNNCLKSHILYRAERWLSWLKATVC